MESQFNLFKRVLDQNQGPHSLIPANLDHAHHFVVTLSPPFPAPVISLTLSPCNHRTLTIKPTSTIEVHYFLYRSTSLRVDCVNGQQLISTIEIDPRNYNNEWISIRQGNQQGREYVGVDRVFWSGDKIPGFKGGHKTFTVEIADIAIYIPVNLEEELIKKYQQDQPSLTFQLLDREISGYFHNTWRPVNQGGVDCRVLLQGQQDTGIVDKQNRIFVSRQNLLIEGVFQDKLTMIFLQLNYTIFGSNQQKQVVPVGWIPIYVADDPTVGQVIQNKLICGPCKTILNQRQLSCDTVSKSIIIDFKLNPQSHNQRPSVHNLSSGFPTERTPIGQNHINSMPKFGEKINLQNIPQINSQLQFDSPNGQFDQQNIQRQNARQQTFQQQNQFGQDQYQHQNYHRNNQYQGQNSPRLNNGPQNDNQNQYQNHNNFGGQGYQQQNQYNQQDMQKNQNINQKNYKYNQYDNNQDKNNLQKQQYGDGYGQHSFQQNHDIHHQQFQQNDLRGQQTDPRLNIPKLNIPQNNNNYHQTHDQIHEQYIQQLPSNRIDSRNQHDPHYVQQQNMNQQYVPGSYLQNFYIFYYRCLKFQIIIRIISIEQTA